LFAFCFFEDASAGYTFLEKQIGIRKAHGPSEFKWRELRPQDKKLVLKNLSLLLKICCRAVLLIETDILNKRHYKKIDRAVNLISKVLEGCFSGGRPEEAALRDALRKKLFYFANGVEVHCDTDFQVESSTVVKTFIRVLSKNKEFGDPKPIYAVLKSHESEPIQVADIIVGVCRWNISQKDCPPDPFSSLWFDKKNLLRLFYKKTVKN